ncbi:MAG: Rrf2 family transcriptional regulator [Phycisphaeraceae bacterium]|jgi:Rrf2 family protein|nr:Rrf2 family transcriptional regulator [Phycisphaeraceae bacterium]
MFSQSAEYAVQAVAWLAAHAPEAQTTQQIADGTQIGASYLSKVLGALSRAGVINSQRGPHGGFALGRAPTQITLFEVIDVIDPIRPLRGGAFEPSSSEPRALVWHDRLEQARRSVEQALRDITVAQLIKSDAKSRHTRRKA